MTSSNEATRPTALLALQYASFAPVLETTFIIADEVLRSEQDVLFANEF